MANGTTMITLGDYVLSTKSKEIGSTVFGIGPDYADPNTMPVHSWSLNQTAVGCRYFFYKSIIFRILLFTRPFSQFVFDSFVPQLTDPTDSVHVTTSFTCSPGTDGKNDDCTIQPYQALANGSYINQIWKLDIQV